MTMEKHGNERNFRIQTTRLGQSQFVITPSGETLEMPAMEKTESVSEKYCDVDGWQEASGVLADILGCPVCGRDW